MSVNLKELAVLIRACKTSGVAELKIGEIEIKFLASETAKTESTSEIASTPTVEQNQSVELGVIQDNVERADDELATMHISDPAQFERLLIERELESGKH